jgi:hypothetical protein
LKFQPVKIKEIKISNDGDDPPSEGRSSYRLDRGCSPAVGDSETRTPERQSASKWGTTSSLEIPVGSFTRRIQATSLDVCFDLTIPPIGHEALEPFREAGELPRPRVVLLPIQDPQHS